MAEIAEKKETQEKKTEKKGEDEIRALKNLFRKIRALSKVFLFLSVLALIPFWSVHELNRLLSFWGFFGLILIFFFSLVAWYLTHALKVVKAWESAVIYRLGIPLRVCKPGLILILWPFDSIIFVQMWERALDVPQQEVITIDGVASVDGLINFKVIDAYKFLTNIENPSEILTDLILASFRQAAGVRTTDKLKEETDKISEETTLGLNIVAGYCDAEGNPISYDINDNLRERKDRERGWGIQITRARLTRVDPPPDVAKAMERLASAKKDAEAVKVGADAQKYKFGAEAKGQAMGLRAWVGALGEDGVKSLIALKALDAIQKGDKFYLPQELASVPWIADLFRKIKDQPK